MNRRSEGPLADESRVNEQRKRDKLAREQEVEDLRYVMANPRGRRFFYRLVYEICGVENSSWNPSALIHFNEGRRSVGIDVKNEAQRTCPRDYLAMIEEKMYANQEKMKVEEKNDE